MFNPSGFEQNQYPNTPPPTIKVASTDTPSYLETLESLLSSVTLPKPLSDFSSSAHSLAQSFADRIAPTTGEIAPQTVLLGSAVAAAATVVMFSSIKRSLRQGVSSGSKEVVYLRNDGKQYEVSLENVKNVGDLRVKAAEATGFDISQIVLAFAGSQLEDDESLRSAGIKSGSKILLTTTSTPLNRHLQPEDNETEGTTGDEQTKKTKKPKKKKKKSAKKSKGTDDVDVPAEFVPAVKAKPTGEQIIASIRATNETTIYPLVEDFLTAPPTGVKLEEEHRRLTETLMAELLKLDSVESSDPDTRLKRKALVKEMQGRLDALDKKFKEVKA